MRPVWLLTSRSWLCEWGQCIINGYVIIINYFIVNWEWLSEIHCVCSVKNTVSDFEIQHQLDCHGRSFLNLFGLFLEISISDLFSKRLYRKVLSQGKNKALVSCKGTELSFFWWNFFTMWADKVITRPAGWGWTLVQMFLKKKKSHLFLY